MTTELAQVKPHSIEPATPAEAAQALSTLCDITREKNRVVLNYITANFKEGTDFGPADPRNNKKTLLKPGAEKICRLFNTRPVWTMDEATWTMLGKPAGVVCYKCEIIDNASGQVVGEGRGAEKVGNKSRDANKAIKAAEKCALVDAALYTFCLSELFTQDLERQALGAEVKDEDDTQATAKDKQALFRQVRQYITASGTKDALEPSKLIMAVATQVLGGEVINTMKELDQVRERILSGRADLRTGELTDNDDLDFPEENVPETNG